MTAREHRYHRYKKALRWAGKMTGSDWDRLSEQTFRDMLLHNECMVHVDGEGNQERIEPYTKEYWDIKDRLQWSEESIKKHGLPVSSTKVEMLTIPEIVERYGLTDEDKEWMTQQVGIPKDKQGRQDGTGETK